MTEEQIVEIVEQISGLEVDELKELAKAIRDLIDEKDVSEDVNVGDLVTFEIRDGMQPKDSTPSISRMLLSLNQHLR
jgi:hypothetical protein